MELRLNTTIDREQAAAFGADAVFCAIGSTPVKPAIPGIESEKVHSAVEVFADPALAQGKVVILGAGLAGSELAIYLKDLGREVELVELGPALNHGGNSCHGVAVMDMLLQKRIPLHLNTRAEAVTEAGVACAGPEGPVLSPADTVVYAVGMRARSEEAMAYYDTAPIFHMIGDCRTSSTILNATGSAYTAAKFLGRYD